MAAKKKASKDTRPQSERFIDAAKKGGADESGKAFEKALNKIIFPKKGFPKDSH